MRPPTEARAAVYAAASIYSASQSAIFSTAPVMAGRMRGVPAFAAGALGTLLAAHISPGVMRWVLALSFFATAAWMFIPDKQPRADTRPARLSRRGARARSVQRR